MEQVFIYGTLKQSFPLYKKGLLGATCLGPYRTVSPYPLFIAADFYGPMMLDRPGEGLQVYGELYLADEERLDVLDLLEDVGSPGSFRSRIEVEPASGGIREQAIGFMKSENWLNPLHSGYIADYQDRRFIPPWDR